MGKPNPVLAVSLMSLMHVSALVLFIAYTAAPMASIAACGIACGIAYVSANFCKKFFQLQTYLLA